MAIDPISHRDLLTALDSPDWSAVLQVVEAAETRLRGSIAGEREGEEIVAKLVALSTHSKWEVRRAVANAAANVPHSQFDGVLGKLARDDNSRVRQAAERAALRRRDSRNASVLGEQHEDRINSVLDDIEGRFGLKARDAVKRAAEQIANTFARELYHELIKLVTPLAVSADRLRSRLSPANSPAESPPEEIQRIGRLVTQLRSVLDAMRAYTVQPVLNFKAESLREVIQEAANVAFENHGDAFVRPSIDIDAPSHVVADIARARLVQALTNVLLNALEAYRDVRSSKPVKVKAELQEGIVAITVEDSGCGMSPEAQRDALTLFATSKQNGTGFGLPLAVKIVESEHGGRLSIDSVKGRGTVVRIIFPQLHQVNPV